MRRIVLRAVITACVILLFAVLIVKAHLPPSAEDTRVFLTGASLCGPNLYKADLQKTFTGGLLVPFFRAPFYACALRPLLHFDFGDAWLGVNLTAAAALVVALPAAVGVPWLSALFIPLFLPFYANIDTGQDGAIMLLVLAGVLLLERRGWDAAAGALLALTLQKPSLFLLLPVALVFQRKWRMLLAYSAAGLLLASVSLDIVGFSGVGDYLELLRRFRTPEGVRSVWGATVYMPVARGLAAYFNSSLLLVLLISGTVWATVQIARRLDFRGAFAFAVAASLFVSPNSGRHDWAILLLPALFFLWHGNGLVRGASFALLVPPLYLAYMALAKETPEWWTVRSSVLTLYMIVTVIGILWRPAPQASAIAVKTLSTGV